MTNKTYKLVDVVGTSEESVAQAIKNAIARASESLKGLGWFEVSQIRGQIQDGNVTEFQVTVKIGFLLLSEADIKKGQGSPTRAKRPQRPLRVTPR
jgi:flavin-binding protein dodecin